MSQVQPVYEYDARPALVPEFAITDEQVALIKQTIMKGASDLELQMFLNLCRAKRLDPLSRQIYGIKTNQGVQMFASIDGLRVIAQRSGEYAGQSGPYWCGDDGQWVDVWLQGVPPAAAKVGVRRIGFSEPTWGVATWRSYGQNKTGPVWKTMPDVMLAKAAEAQALRKAFPDDLSGLYAKEEFHDDQRSQREAAAAEGLGGWGQGAVKWSQPEEDGDSDIIDAETGEVETVETIRAEIGQLASERDLTAEAVQGLAKSIRADYRNLDGARQLRAALLDIPVEQPQRDWTA